MQVFIRQRPILTERGGRSKCKSKRRVSLISMHKTDNRLKIAYLTNEHAHDKRSLSSALYYMERALERHCGEVIYLERVLSWKKRYVARLMQEATKHILKRRIVERRLLFVAKKQAKV